MFINLTEAGLGLLDGTLATTVGVAVFVVAVFVVVFGVVVTVTFGFALKKSARPAVADFGGSFVPFFCQTLP